MALGYPTSDMMLGLKGQRSRSQVHKVQKVQKHIEGDRVAGESYALYRLPSLIVRLYWTLCCEHHCQCTTVNEYRVKSISQNVDL